MKSIFRYVFTIIIFFLGYACTNNRNKETELINKEQIYKDSTSLNYLVEKYFSTNNKDDLNNVIRKIDIQLMKDSLNVSTINLLETKYMFLQFFNKNDSIDYLLDSISKIIDNYYLDLISDYPPDPSIYFKISNRYKEKEMEDSSKYYLNKALSISDSILKIKPYDKNSYTIMIYSYIELHQYKEALEIVKQDIDKNRNNDSLSFLQELYFQLIPFEQVE